MDLDVLRDNAYMDIFDATKGGDKTDLGNYLNQDDVVANIFNDSAIKTEKELFEKWNISEGKLNFDDYKNLDYDLMEELGENIRKCYTGKSLYRDGQLQLNAENILIKNELIKKKLEDGESGTISEIEEEVIKKFAGKEEAISYILPEHRKNVERYRDLYYRREFISGDEFNELEQLKNELSKVEGLPKNVEALVGLELDIKKSVD